VTPTIAYLRAQPKPFRIAPFFIYLWPNTSELYELEDVRSHFSSEAKYRRLLQRIDPTSFANNSTVITFNSLKFDFADPLISMLGVRYYLENRDIDIIKWTTFKNTIPGRDTIYIAPGTTVQRMITIDAEPFYAIELPVNIERQTRRDARLLVWLFRNNSIVFSRAFTPADISVMNRVYIPLPARPGEVFTVRMHSIGIRGTIAFYGRVKVPVIFDRELPDGRLFLNAGEVPRFHTVTRLRKMTETQFLASRDIDFSQEAILTGAAEVGGASLSNTQVVLRSYKEDEQQIEVEGPTFLASSEKLTPELRVTVDGKEAKPVEINMMFAGLHIPAGRHQVIFSRRIGRGWWWLSAAAAIVCVTLSIIDVARR
jgi:hypothetical protein